YGQQVPIDDMLPEGLQHRGYGRQLLQRCEELAWDRGANKVLVTSGIGARGYYRKFGYEVEGPYMAKNGDSR
ncbi:MAG: GNAT family N-acetyltransferase, partial [Methanomassiliicoccales archaeon]|nr:GNAT family N-acetyltransferase [Methanomassiliicoccales archaeon]